MMGKVVHGVIDPRFIGLAVTAVREELLPQFERHPGARQGYWMADRASGQTLIVTLWSDLVSLESARGVDGAERSTVADRIGLRLHAIQTMHVVAHHRDDHVDRPLFRSVRATWVSSLASNLGDRVLPLFEEIVPDQARSTGFRGSCWLADAATGAGLALSCWDNGDALTASGRASRRRRTRVQRQLGFAVEGVHLYEGLGVAVRSDDESAGASVGALRGSGQRRRVDQFLRQPTTTVP